MAIDVRAASRTTQVENEGLDCARFRGGFQQVFRQSRRITKLSSFFGDLEELRPTDFVVYWLDGVVLSTRARNFIGRDARLLAIHRSNGNELTLARERDPAGDPEMDQVEALLAGYGIVF